MARTPYKFFVAYPRDAGNLQSLLEDALGQGIDGGGQDSMERDVEFFLASEQACYAAVLALAPLMPPHTRVWADHHPDAASNRARSLFDPVDLQVLARQVQARLLDVHTPMPAISRSAPRL